MWDISTLDPVRRSDATRFWRGADLDDPKRLLKGTGTKMRHIKVASVADIPKTQIRSWVRQAMELNQATGDPKKGR